MKLKLLLKKIFKIFIILLLMIRVLILLLFIYDEVTYIIKICPPKDSNINETVYDRNYNNKLNTKKLLSVLSSSKCPFSSKK